MFKKLLSQIGIGSSKIDFVIENTVLVMGEEVRGKLVIQGGEVPQQIGGISIDLKVESMYSANDQNRSVSRVVKSEHVSEALTIQPGEKREFSVSFMVPTNIPITCINTKYHFLTNLDIKEGLDSKDRDYVQVLPSGIVRNFLEGMKGLGFVPYRESYTGNDQIIDFRPTTWLAGKLDELVFAFNPTYSQSEMSGYFEVDKRNTGLGGWLADELDLDERKGRYRFTQNELGSVEQAQATLRHFIESHFNSLA
jgi:sporulation-control protein